jgi:invasion protein IalB
MKKGTQLGITFQNTQKKTITMPISLAGFTTAYSSIE